MRTPFLSGLLFLVMFGCGDTADEVLVGGGPTNYDTYAWDTIDAGNDINDTTKQDVVDASDTPDIEADTGICEPGTSYCDQDFLVSCTKDGAEVTKCESGCVDGACNQLQPVCEPGTIVCQPTTKKLLECAEDGLSATTLEVCPHGCAEGSQVCSEPVCEEGETRCAADDPTYLELCNSDQSGFEKAALPCKEVCQDGACFVPACDAGSTQCGATGVEACNSAQDGYDILELCKSGCVLTPDGPVCAKCSVGQSQCKGAVVEVCEDALVGFVETEACADIETCVNAQCLNVVKLEASSPKADNFRLLVKAFAACFETAVEGVCSSIDSSDLGYDITPSQISNWFCDNKDDTPGFEAEWPSEIWLAAIDVMGCGAFDLEDMSIEGGAILGGQSGTQCVAYDGGGLFTINNKEIVVDNCDNLSVAQNE